MTRFLLYSHDTYGLGHLRRSTLLADAIVQADPRHEVLIVTGSPQAQAFSLPDRVDSLKLPSATKDGAGAYQPRKLGGSIRQLVELRSAVLMAAIDQLRPRGDRRRPRTARHGRRAHPDARPLRQHNRRPPPGPGFARHHRRRRPGQSGLATLRGLGTARPIRRRSRLRRPPHPHDRGRTRSRIAGRRNRHLYRLRRTSDARALG